MAPKKSHGKKARITKLRDLLKKEQWTAKSSLANSIPLTVTIYDYRDYDRDRDEEDHKEKVMKDFWELDLLTTAGSKEDANILPEYVQVKCVVVQNEEEEKLDKD